MKYYTIEEVMEILKCSKYHVMCLVRSGRIKGLKIGKAWRFAEQAITGLTKISDEVDFKPTIFVMHKKRGRKTQC